jgi:hypothetical protein
MTTGARRGRFSTGGIWLMLIVLVRSDAQLHEGHHDSGISRTRSRVVAFTARYTAEVLPV